MPTLITAGDASNGVVVTSSNDNALTIQTGAAGAKVDAIALASDGTMTLNKPMAGGSLTLATAQATTSGTAIDFTSIPSWVKRITVMFNGVSTNGTSVPIVQLGTSGSGIVTAGYTGSSSIIAGTVSTANNTVGIGLAPSWGAAITVSGTMVITLLNAATGLWSASSCVGDSGAANTFVGGSAITLSGTLDRLRFKPQNGTDTFDAGSVNIMYEG